MTHAPVPFFIDLLHLDTSHGMLTSPCVCILQYSPTVDATEIQSICLDVAGQVTTARSADESLLLG